MKLREYQKDGVEEIRSHFMSGEKKVLLHLATGAGKTVIFSHILKTTSERGKRAIMVVRGRKLVNQASDRLTREGVFHGVHMAGHWNFKPHASVQVCSIDTLRARKIKPEADIIVIDEAHMATSPSYVDLISNYPDAFILAVTATPYVAKTLRHVANVVVKPTSMKQLVDDGFLVPPRYFSPGSPDLSGVEVSKATNDYKTDQLANVMDQSGLVGDMVEHWRDIAEGRPTIAFAVTVKHSKHIAERFNEAGIPAVHIDANTPESERRDAEKDLIEGRIKLISNVGIYCIGVDIPALGCIIMGRPTKSYILYVQQAGRGTRVHESKSDFILLDHAGNVVRHGFIDDEPMADLDGKVLEPKMTQITTCKKCFGIYEGRKPVCPYCGYVKTPEELKTEVMQFEGRLKELTQDTDENRVKKEIARLKKMRKLKGYKHGWVWHRVMEKFGGKIADDDALQELLPDWVKRTYRIGSPNSDSSFSNGDLSSMEVQHRGGEAR